MNDLKIFELKSKLKSIQVELEEKEDYNFNSQWDLITKNYSAFKEPLQFVRRYKKKYLDFIDTGWPQLYLISEKVKEVLEKNSLKGWSTESVQILGENNKLIKGYYLFSITGRIGNIDYSRCKVVEKKYSENGPSVKVVRGLIFEPSNFEENDFFMANNSYKIFLSEKAKFYFLKNKISNVNFINVEDVEIDFISVKETFHE